MSGDLRAWQLMFIYPSKLILILSYDLDLCSGIPVRPFLSLCKKGYKKFLSVANIYYTEQQVCVEPDHFDFHLEFFVPLTSRQTAGGLCQVYGEFRIQP